MYSGHPHSQSIFCNPSSDSSGIPRLLEPTNTHEKPAATQGLRYLKGTAGEEREILQKNEYYASEITIMRSGSDVGTSSPVFPSSIGFFYF